MTGDTRTNAPADVPWRERGLGLAILTRTCGQCLKPRNTAGGSVRYVRGLVKKSFVCAPCVEKMA